MIEALAEKTSDGWIVSAPAVGILRGWPRAGSHRSPGEVVGRLRLLGHARDLTLPAGVSGVVADLRVQDRAAPVQYGQPLFTLRAANSASAPAATAESRPGAAPAGALPSGWAVLPCPIDGIFYRRPGPAQPPFVEPGAAIQSGRTVGLIEAMKSFNAVIYEGPGLPEAAVVEEIRAADGAEVRQGQPLLVVRPRP